MRLEKLRIQNFRSFKDETIEFDSYTCLVGPNGAGKSTVLTALNVFFRNTNSASTNMVVLSKEDFHHGNVADPIRITLTFKDLSAEAQSDLAAYYRHDRLTVTAKAVWADGGAEVKQCGQRLVMVEFSEFFKAEEQKAKAGERLAIYDNLRKTFTDLPEEKSATGCALALRIYEDARQDLCTLVESDHQFFGFTRGKDVLEKYVQWVYVPAVKDASTEQQDNSKCALKDLLDRTVRSKVNFKDPIKELKKKAEEEYREIIAANKNALDQIESSMRKRLKEWASPSAMLSLQWHYDDNKTVQVAEPFARASIGEDSFIGEVARLGHGMQRSFLISVLHELASLNTEQGPTLILGFEEPELYQHPPQAQHMSAVLEGLATNAKSNTQVLISTHSPHFVSSKGFENVRVVRKRPEDKCSLVASTTFEKVGKVIGKAMNDRPQLPSAVMATIEQIMQPSQKEIYFARVAVLVEGLEDIAFIATHLVQSDQWNDFRRLGCHFIATGSKNNISRPLAIANELCIKTFTIFDADANAKKKEEIDNHIRANSCILRLCGLETFDPMPKTSVFFENCVMWSTNIGDIVQQEAGKKVWDKAADEVRADGFQGTSVKNMVFVARVMEKLGREKEFTSQSLTELCTRLLAFAERTQPRPEEALEQSVTSESFAEQQNVAAV